MCEELQATCMILKCNSRIHFGLFFAFIIICCLSLCFSIRSFALHLVCLLRCCIFRVTSFASPKKMPSSDVHILVLLGCMGNRFIACFVLYLLNSLAWAECVCVFFVLFFVAFNQSKC